MYARRIHDETTVKPDDVEVFEEERSDEFSKYFSNEVKPKIMISTRPKCSRKLFPFIADLMQMIPNAFYYPRGKPPYPYIHYHLSQIFASYLNCDLYLIVTSANSSSLCEVLVVRYPYTYVRRYIHTNSKSANVVGTLLVEDLVKDASSKGFTHLMILAEKQKECNGYVWLDLTCTSFVYSLVHYVCTYE